jgi:hypothetical protein
VTDTVLPSGLVPDVEEAPVAEQTNVTLAALFAALAQTFNQTDDTFVSRFAENLDRVCFELKDLGGDNSATLSTLRATTALLTALTRIPGSAI